jgi:hypothetical protein
MSTNADPVPNEPSEASRCSRCRKTKPNADFIGVRKNTCTTCLSCRTGRPKSNDLAKAWRLKQKKAGIIVDKRGRNRSAYMKQYNIDNPKGANKTNEAQFELNSNEPIVPV